MPSTGKAARISSPHGGRWAASASTPTARATLYIGREQWPFPFPLARGADGGWAFDPEAGRQTVIDRRIGSNELDVIELLKAYVRVQSDYRRTDWDGDGVMEFAASLISGEGARDGLYWPSAPGDPASPVGDVVARAAAEGYAVGAETAGPDPYLGYVYRILQSQGPNAAGGEMAYPVNGQMLAGHALIAWPAEYGETGVTTFMVAENGVVLQADLGEATPDAAGAIDRFDPDAGWTSAE